jgi:uncharacterized membrane protein YbhN (UPF0104 family)
MNEYIRPFTRMLREHGLWMTGLLTVAVFFGLFLFSNASAVVAVLLAVDMEIIAVVLCLVTLGYWIRFLKWAYYLHVLRIDVPLRASLLVFFSGLMLVVTPGKVGEVWKAWFLRDLESVSVGRVVPVIGAERVTDLLALAAFALLGPLLYQQSALLGLAVVCVFLIGLGIIQWRSLCLRLLAGAQSLPIVGPYAADAETFYDRAYALFRPQPLGIAMFLSLAAWGLEGIALWIVLSEFSTAVGPVLGLFVFGFGSVVGALSFLPGGLGATEATMVGTLVLAGIPRSVAAGATLIIRLGTLWYGAAFGAVVFALYRLRHTVA